MAQLVKPLPSAQVMIPGSWDQVPHRAPCSAGSLLLSLPLPASLPACVYSLSLSLSGKQIKILKTKKQKNKHLCCRDTEVNKTAHALTTQSLYSTTGVKEVCTE